MKHRVQDRSFVYRPTRARKQVARSAMTRLVDVFYEGSVTQTMNGLLQLRDAKLNDDEWEELSDLIAQARTQQQEDTP